MTHHNSPVLTQVIGCKCKLLSCDAPLTHKVQVLSHFLYLTLYSCLNAPPTNQHNLWCHLQYLSRTCTSVRDRPPRVREARGIALTRPVKPSEGTDRNGPPRTTRARILNKHLPIQEKPGLKPDTRSHSQVTHVIWLLINQWTFVDW